MIEFSGAPSHAGLRITTLGGLSITCDGATVTGLASRKAEAMLVYLACTRRPHARDVLADLLWDDASTTRARGNLSVLLTSLRQQLGAYLRIDRHSVAFNSASPHWIDVSEMEVLIANAYQARHDPIAQNLMPARTAEQVDRALALYRGDFLQGFGVRESAGFEAWMIAEQERLRRLVLAAGEQLVATFLQQRAYGTGITHATKLLQLDPMHEELHRQIMQLLTYSGQRAAAVAHYEICRRTLDDELGVTPSAETTALYERIRRGELSEPVAPPVAAHAVSVSTQTRPTLRLPVQPTPLVGREADLQNIADRLTDSHCRLLTLLGPGGIGKTRLALETAARLGPTFREGAAFVALASIDTANQISTAIANAVGFTLSGRRDPDDELFTYLHDKHLLLVLDNFEQLLDGVTLVDNILQHAPEIQIVVTSRERLYVRAEWLFDVDGLHYPDTDFDANVDSLDSYSAVELFVRQARRIQPHFAITPHTVAPIARICRLVGGTPLALEMAAGWSRSFSCVEIEHKISATIDSLATTFRDVPERHRSMRAVFEQSWRMLTADERDLLRRLSVFHNGWMYHASEQIATATSSLLTALCDKSLVRLGGDERYNMHPLLRQFALEQLKAVPDLEQQVMQQHSTYFLQLVEANQTALSGREPHKVVTRLQLEWENVRHAWHWAMAHRIITAIDGSVATLAHLYVLTGRLREGEDLFASAVTEMTGWKSDLPPLQTLGRVLIGQATLLNRRGLHDQALPVVTRALEIAITMSTPNLEAACRYAIGDALLGQGSYDTAEEHLQLAVVLAEAAGERGMAAYSHRLLGVLATNKGNYTDAQQACTKALHDFRALGDRRGESLVLNNIGVIAEQQGAYAAAQDAYETALQIHREIGDQHGAGYVLCNLGVVTHGLGNYQLAQDVYNQALAIFRETGDRLSEGIALNNLGDTALALGDHEAARLYQDQSLVIRREIGDPLGETYTLASLALLQHHCGDHAAAKATSLATLQMARAINARSPEAILLTHLGHALHALGELDEAHDAYHHAMTLHRALSEHHRAIEALSGLVRVALAKADTVQARSSAHMILMHIHEHSLCGTEEPIRIYLTCYHALLAANDHSASTMLESAHELLLSQAAHITSPTQKQAFMTRVPANHALLTEYARVRVAVNSTDRKFNS